jgi:hypothetical protein
MTESGLIPDPDCGAVRSRRVTPSTSAPKGMRLSAPSGGEQQRSGLSQKLAHRLHRLLIQRPGESVDVGSIRVAQSSAPGLNCAVNRYRFAQVHPLGCASRRDDVRDVAGLPKPS